MSNSYSNFKYAILKCLTLLFILLSGRLASQTTELTNTDSLKIKNSTLDTTKNVDSLSIPISKDAITSPVMYKAEDSIIFDLGTKKAYLYGVTQTNYEDIELKSELMDIDWEKNEVDAKGALDSTGKLVGKPEFSQGEQKFTSTEMRYNFKSKKGIIQNINTKQDEDYLLGDRVKVVRVNDKDIIYGKDMKYTTCDHPNPHYYIQTNKAKVIPQDKVITGPALMKIADVPLPLVLPFGFFPAQSRKSTGIVIPAISEDRNRGFGFRNAGFYYGMNDYFDALLSADLFTNGSYYINGITKYKKRYRYTGALDIGRGQSQFGIKETPSYFVTNDFKIRWNHQQDPKATASSNFSANVNIESSTNRRNFSNNLNEISRNDLQSSITYQKRFLGTPFNLTLSGNHSQNISDKSMTIALPRFTLGMNRIYPLKPKNAIVKRWYHDINMSYSLNGQNQISTFDSLLFSGGFRRNDFSNGLRQEIPLNSNFKVLKYFNLSPNITITSLFYPNRVNISTSDTARFTRLENGLYSTHNIRGSATLSTIIYGLKEFKSGLIRGIRHQMTPNLSFIYAPDVESLNREVYRTYTDFAGNVINYNVFDNSLFNIFTYGNGDAQRQGSLNFGINNNLQLKVRDAKDTLTGTKKITLIEQFNMNANYNFLLDSFNLSNINFSGIISNLIKGLSSNFNFTLNPYHIENNVTTKEYAWNVSGELGRITNANIGLNYNLNPAAGNKPALSNIIDPRILFYYGQPTVDFSIPWNLALNYTLNYANTTTKVVTQIVNLTGDINLTKNWKVTATSGYDVTNKEITNSQIQIYRDLHCWEMGMTMIPFGRYQSYMFNINIKANSLKDLKLNKRQNFYENF